MKSSITLLQRSYHVVRAVQKLPRYSATPAALSSFFSTVNNTPTEKKFNIREEIIINSSKIDNTPNAPTTATPSSSAKPAVDDSLEKEKYLYALKRDMSTLYSKGDYEAALQKAVDLQDEVITLYGKKNAIYASCLNNIALMQKMLGHHEAALEQYISALQVYKEVNNNNTLSISYASTLYNIGILYKQMAETSKGMERSQYVDRAEEAVTDAHKLRVQMHGPNHKDSVTSAIMVASVQRLRGKTQEAIDHLLKTLRVAEDAFGSSDLIVATIFNNLGIYYKHLQDFDNARNVYERALKIRSKTLGDNHPESIVTMHNLAECHLAAGNEEQANNIQQQIIKLVGGDKQEAAEPAAPAEAPVIQQPASMQPPKKAVTAATIEDTSRVPKPSEIARRQLEREAGNTADRDRRNPPVTFSRPKLHVSPATRKKGQ